MAIKNLGDFLRSLVGLGDGSDFSVAVITLAENGTILASERDALIFAHNQDHQTARKSIEILGFYARPAPNAAPFGPSRAIKAGGGGGRAWDESKAKRRDDGRFGSGASGRAPKKKVGTGRTRGGPVIPDAPSAPSLTSGLDAGMPTLAAGATFKAPAAPIEGGITTSLDKLVPMANGNLALPGSPASPTVKAPKPTSEQLQARRGQDRSIEANANRVLTDREAADFEHYAAKTERAEHGYPLSPEEKAGYETLRAKALAGGPSTPPVAIKRNAITPREFKRLKKLNEDYVGGFNMEPEEVEEFHSIRDRLHGVRPAPLSPENLTYIDPEDIPLMKSGAKPGTFRPVTRDGKQAEVDLNQEDAEWFIQTDGDLERIGIVPSNAKLELGNAGIDLIF